MSTKMTEKDRQAEAPCLTIADNQSTPLRLFQPGRPWRNTEVRRLCRLMRVGLPDTGRLAGKV